MLQWRCRPERMLVRNKILVRMRLQLGVSMERLRSLVLVMYLLLRRGCLCEEMRCRRGWVGNGSLDAERIIALLRLRPSQEHGKRGFEGRKSAYTTPR